MPKNVANGNLRKLLNSAKLSVQEVSRAENYLSTVVAEILDTTALTL